MTEQNTQTAPKKLQGLRLNQRNLMQYYRHHRTKHPNSPCFVPRTSVHHLEQYIKALEKLEELQLVTIIRDTPNYQGWLMVPYRARGNEIQNHTERKVNPE